MKRRVMAIALIFWMLLSSCIVILPVAAEEADVWDGSVASGFAGGDGSEKNPYIIETAEQLAFLAQSVNAGEAYEGKYFKLTSDLVLNDESFTFEADTGLIQVTDGEHVGYLGTGVNGDDSGENTVFDKSVPRQGMWYDRETGQLQSGYDGILQSWIAIGNENFKFAGFF